MGVRELKNRARSLLAWTLTFALIVGAMVFGVPEIRISAEPGVTSVTVSYLDESGSETGSTGVFYQSGSEAEGYTVTIDTSGAPETTGTYGELLMWQVVSADGSSFPVYIGAGQQKTISWEEISTGETIDYNQNIQVSLKPVFVQVILEATKISNADVIGKCTVVHGADDTYTIQPPGGTPEMYGYNFIGWQLTEAATKQTFNYDFELGEFVNSDGIPVQFTYAKANGDSVYDVSPLTENQAMVIYYDSVSATTPYNVVNVGEGGEDVPPVITVGEAPAADGKSFLSWYNNFGQSYYLPGETIEYATWQSMQSSNIVDLRATWLTAEFESSDISFGTYSGSVSVIPAGTAASAGYTLQAPKEIPVAEDPSYIFNNWMVYTDSLDTGLSAEAGGVVSTEEDLVPYSFSYGEDTTVSFAANWITADSAEVIFDLSEMGEYVDEENITHQSMYYHTVYQSEKTQTTYTVTMPSGTPTRAGYTFAGWEYVTEAETFVYAANETPDFTWNFGETEVPPTFTALWLAEAAINYADPSGIPLQEEIVRTQVEGETEFTLTLPQESLATTVPNDAVFLIWSDSLNSISADRAFYLPGETVTVYWDNLAEYENSINFVSLWLRQAFIHGTEDFPVDVGSWSGLASVVNRGENVFNLQAPQAPTVEGKIFTGWTIIGADFPYSAESGGIFTTSSADSLETTAVEFDYGNYAYSTMTIQSNWQDASMARVTFNANGGTYAGTAQTIYQTEVGQTDFEVTLPTNAEVTRTGYILSGWQYTNEAGEVQIFETGDAATATLSFGADAGSTMEYELSAIWKRSAVINYVMVPDGEVVQTETIDGEEADTSFTVTLPADIPAGEEGSSFLAWYSNLGTPQYGQPGAVMTFHWENVTNSNGKAVIEAQWIDFLYDGVETAEWSGKATLSAEETVVNMYAPENLPVEEGKFFLGWNVTIGDEVLENIQAGGQVGTGLDYASVANQTITFTAQWQEQATATITFDLNGGILGDSMENVVQTMTQTGADVVNYVVTMLAAPLKEGYNFDGWVTTVRNVLYTFAAEESTEGSDLALSYNEDTDVTFTAQWVSVTPTPTPTPTNTPTPTVTPIPTATPTSTPTPVPTSTPTPVPTNTPTPVPTSTPTPVPTSTPTPVPTSTPTPVPTNTPMPVPTSTPTPVPTSTPTPVPTSTPTPVPTSTPTPVPTSTPTPVPTSTPTPVPTSTPTPVPTSTPTPVPTSTPTPIPTATPVPTPTPVPTEAPSPTPEPTANPQGGMSAGDSVITLSAGTVELIAGQKYRFPAGKWLVNDDPSVYEGGIEFYVAVSGTYVISEGE